MPTSANKRENLRDARSTPQSTPTLEEMQRAEKTGALVMSARAALRRWQNDDARKLLHQALQIDPTDAGALELAGDLFMAEGEQEKALRAFERGFKAHPSNVAFEEKIALCYLDLQEMKLAQERKEALAQGLLKLDEGVNLLDKVPSKAFGLSVLLPGAGQFYNDETRRGVLLLGAWLIMSLLWYVPIFIGYRLLSQNIKATPIKALDALPSFWQGWFWLMTALFVVLYIVAAADAWRGAERANRARQEELDW